MRKIPVYIINVNVSLDSWLLSATNKPMQLVNVGPCLAEQCTLLEVEDMLMEVQQARKDLETYSTLAEVQEGWSDPTLPISTNNHSEL